MTQLFVKPRKLEIMEEVYFKLIVGSKGSTETTEKLGEHGAPADNVGCFPGTHMAQFPSTIVC